MESTPAVGVILLNWNRWADTIECMESLLRLDYERVHIIVCDQASTDDSLDRIRKWAAGSFEFNHVPNPALAHLTIPPSPKPVSIVEYDGAEVQSGQVARLSHQIVLIRSNRNLGSAGGNNMGLQFLFAQPTIKYAWILNNDIVVARDSLGELVAQAEADQRVGAVGGRLMDYRDITLQQTAGGGRYSPWRGYPTPVQSVRLLHHPDGSTSADLDWITGGNMLSPIAALRKVGPIDEDYFLYMEDIEHALRLTRAGYRFAFAPNSRVWHKGGATVGYQSATFVYYMVRNAIIVAQRHRPALLPFVAAYTLYRVVLPKIARRDWRRALVAWRAYRDARNGVTGRVTVE